MKNVVLVVLVVLGAWGCGGGKPKPVPPIAENTAPSPTPDAAPPMTEFQTAMAAMTRFKDEMCTCKDTACAQRVSDEMTKWSEGFQKPTKAPMKMTDEETKAAVVIGEAMGKCMQTAMGGGTP